MAQTPENTHQRIRRIRKTLQRSIHDCASILEISKEQYLGFEQGTHSLSLPDIEILAFYLGTPVNELFEDHSPREDQLSLLKDNVRFQYRQLREKMIRTKLVIELQQAELSFENIHKTTLIPLDALKAYEIGQAVIPVEHLQQISECLGKPLSIFFSDNLGLSEDLNPEQRADNWEQEFPEGDSVRTSEPEEPYSQLMEALKKIPKEDQAQIAKILLNKLKSI